MSHPWQFYRPFGQNWQDIATSKHIVTIGFLVNYRENIDNSKYNVTICLCRGLQAISGVSKRSVTIRLFGGYVGTRKSSDNRETKWLLKVWGNEWPFLTSETKRLNFLTSVYIFRSVDRVVEIRANRARGGSLLRRVKGSALNNPISHW